MYAAKATANHLNDHLSLSVYIYFEIRLQTLKDYLDAFAVEIKLDVFI